MFFPSVVLVLFSPLVFCPPIDRPDATVERCFISAAFFLLHLKGLPGVVVEGCGILHSGTLLFSKGAFVCDMYDGYSL